MKLNPRLLLSIPMALAVAASTAVAQTKEVTIAYQDMIVPYRVAQSAGAIEKATGYKIAWKQFAGGGDVIKAMASGQVPLGEAGSSPITAAAAQGIDIQVIWVLDDINNAEQLIASKKSGIKTLADLKGKKVATPFVSTAHYQLLFALNKAGVNPKEIQILNLRPPEIAAAWERGDLDATFIWEPVLSKVKADGTLITSSADVGKQGAPTFDGIIANRAWAAQHKDFVTGFVKIMAQADADYRANPGKYAKGSDNAAAIAKVVGAKPDDVPAVLADYAFPTAAEQASDKWLGGGANGGVAKALANTAQFLLEQKRITEVPKDFGKFVNPEFAAAAAK
ncbi:taurine ABC transporter substrate-binding protein [Hyphomicrobium sp. CS1BSMeth3]|uniref:taurine ABC transporter substrate-binding protein n=1 Tax=Hyphomicrobium sp. CS1BSMeth3 TaxID=1892844 RepID=UPI00086C79A4|nr:taurine ABC transporter substrate-binding protein [Hyphomicrobium sp. CS1BSMeth3]ODT17797.1 MAG: taurine ABC transporter substrate-binding protein [Hyphomicrobium sp. SCN 65-11]